MMRRGLIDLGFMFVICLISTILYMLFMRGWSIGGWGYVLCVPGGLIGGVLALVFTMQFCMWSYYASRQFLWKMGWGSPPPPPAKTWL